MGIKAMFMGVFDHFACLFGGLFFIRLHGLLASLDGLLALLRCPCLTIECLKFLLFFLKQ